MYKLEILPLDEKDTARKEKQTVKDPKGYIALVHGICHGAWRWDNFITFFCGTWYQCYAVSLREHGSSEGKSELDSFTLSDCVEYVEAVVNMCPTKPFLLGHSMGDAVVQKYIGKRSDKVLGAILFATATASRMKLIQTLKSTKSNDHLSDAPDISFGKITNDKRNV